MAPMVKLSETPAAIVRPAPLVGEHTPESLPNMAMAQPKSTTWSPAASAARRSAPDR
nr:CoA transferase [Mesorhizobium tamadayense]